MDTRPKVRFVQIDMLHSVVHGGNGFPIPDGAGWTPFQVEFRQSIKGHLYVCLAIWLVEDKS